MTNIQKNLIFAFASNTAGISYAAGILYPFTGLLMVPMIAALRLPPVRAITNALRFRALRL